MENEKVWFSIKQRLQQPKPGLTAQLKMATYPRPGDQLFKNIKDKSIDAGVLVLLFPEKQKHKVLLTLRTNRLLHHRSQISFPGGRQEPNEDLTTTALRETQEELGISPDSIKILGELTSLYISPSNYCIYPTVGVTNRPPECFPQPSEVAEVLKVPLDFLFDTSNVHYEDWVFSERKVSVPFYFFQGHKIWGATAMVLAELLEIIKPAIKR